MCSNLSMCTLDDPMHLGIQSNVSEWHNYAKNKMFVISKMCTTADYIILHFYWIFCPKNTLCTQLKRQKTLVMLESHFTILKFGKIVFEKLKKPKYQKNVKNYQILFQLFLFCLKTRHRMQNLFHIMPDIRLTHRKTS